MALLDSLYGETPSYFGGLLGEDELKRLQGQAQSQSNLGMAAALLRAGAPSRTPGGGALAIAEGLQMGQQAYKQALNQGLQEKMQGMQVQDLLRKQQEARQIRQLSSQLINPAVAAGEMNFSGSPDQIAQYFQTPGQAVIPTTSQAMPASVNMNVASRIAQLSADPLAAYSNLAKLVPDLRKAGFVGAGTQGENPFDIFVADATIPAPLRAAAAQYQKSYASGQLDPEKADERVRQLAQSVQSAQQFAQTQAGMDAAREDRRIAQAGVSAAREQTAATNAILADTRKEALEAKREERQKPVAEAKESLQLINQAEKLLDSATGSLTGTGIDVLAGAVGMSTPGAQSASKLKAIQGALVAKMPKMSGPQSDKDVLLYREMAAQVGDSTIPADTRRAALGTLREIQERYAKVEPGSSVPPMPATTQTSPFKFDAAKEDRYQQWLKSQGR
jgi:hypothetical protein